MKIKIRNTIYDDNEEPVMIILSKQDKKNIINMHPDNKKYCSFPDHLYTPKEIKKWMKNDSEKMSLKEYWIKILRPQVDRYMAKKLREKYLK